MAKITVALEVFDTPYHVTLAFFKTRGDKLPKVRTSLETGSAEVLAVEYWPGSNVTVALVDSRLVDDRVAYWWVNGYPYEGYSYRAHFTIGKGDLRSETAVAPGQVYQLGGEYWRVFG